MSVEEVLLRVPVAKPELKSAVQDEGLEQVTSVVVTPVAVVYVHWTCPVCPVPSHVTVCCATFSLSSLAFFPSGPSH